MLYIESLDLTNAIKQFTVMLAQVVFHSCCSFWTSVGIYLCSWIEKNLLGKNYIKANSVMCHNGSAGNHM